MTDRTKLTLLTLGGFALVLAFIVSGGCTKQDLIEPYVIEASGHVIGDNDIPIKDELPKIDDPLKPEPDPNTDREPDHECGCSPTCPCSKGRCLCATGGTCGPNCTCGKPKSPWAGQKLYRTPFYCPRCGHFSVYMAPLTLRSTKCEECLQQGAVRTEFEYQRRAREQRLFRGAAMSRGLYYRAGAAGC